MRRLKWIIISLVTSILLTQPFFLSCTPIAKPPQLITYPSQLNFSTTKGENTENKRVASLYISNMGDGEIHWIVDQCPSWLSIQPATGICTAENSTVKVSINDHVDSLAEGHHAAIFRFYDMKSTLNVQTIAVNLEIKPALFKTYIDPRKRFSFKYPREFEIPPDLQHMTNPEEHTIQLVSPLDLMGKGIAREWVAVFALQPKGVGQCNTFLSADSLNSMARASAEANNEGVDLKLIEYGGQGRIWDAYAHYCYTSSEDPALKKRLDYFSAMYFKCLPAYFLWVDIRACEIVSDTSPLAIKKYQSAEYKNKLKSKAIIDSFVFY